MLGAAGVDTVDHGRQGGRFAGTGHARDQYQAARHFADLFDDFGKIEFIQCANFGGNDAKHKTHIAALLENVHTETSQACDAVCHVDFSGFFELLLLAGRHHAERHGEHIFRAHARLVG